MLAFSVWSAPAALATGLASLMVLRAMMGFADGAYTPPSIIATLEASHPTRHGRNLGIQQMMMPLFGLGLAPIIVTQLLHGRRLALDLPLVSIPGIVVAFLLYRVLRNPSPELAAEHTLTHDASPHKLDRRLSVSQRAAQHGRNALLAHLPSSSPARSCRTT